MGLAKLPLNYKITQKTKLIKFNISTISAPCPRWHLILTQRQLDQPLLVGGERAWVDDVEGDDQVTLGGGVLGVGHPEAGDHL